MHKRIGGIALPLRDTDETTLVSLDPARDIMLDLFEAALNAELGPRWADAAVGIPKLAATPVGSTFPFEPDAELLQQVGTQMPALFVYRDAEGQTARDLSLSKRGYTCTWGVDYLIGALSLGDRRKLYDVLQAAGKILSEVVERGGHAAYAVSQHNAIQPKLTLTEDCRFDEARVTEFRAGPATLSAQGPRWYALSLKLETVEVATPEAGEEWSWGGVMDLKLSPENVHELVLGTTDAVE